MLLECESNPADCMCMNVRVYKQIHNLCPSASVGIVPVSLNVMILSRDTHRTARLWNYSPIIASERKSLVKKSRVRVSNCEFSAEHGIDK
jgi:hypothetical protein